jgi:hypothetical protein
MSDNIIGFPGGVAGECEVSDRDTLHAEAFRDLENRLCDCVSMAQIAFEQIQNFKTDDRELLFAVAHSWEMLAKLKRDYYADYHGEKAGGLDKSSI